MSELGKTVTQETYEDKEIVEGYIENHAHNPKMFEKLNKFSQMIEGKNIIDIGCGPGQDSLEFARLGFNVVGVDLSSSMINAAKRLKENTHKPDFQVMNMKGIGDNFEEDQFDAAWACASLLHLEIDEVPIVLEGIHKIVKNNGVVYIALKAGDVETKVVKEDKYGKPMERQFTFWKKEEFEKLLDAHGFETTNMEDISDENPWLDFICRIRK